MYNHTGLQNWYEALQNFAPVTLDSKLLDGCDPFEQCYARLNYHWQMLLRGRAVKVHYTALLKLQAEMVAYQEDSTKKSQLTRVLAAVYVARAAALQGERVASIQKYLTVLDLVETMLRKESPNPELFVFSMAYSMGHRDFSSNLLYYTILPLLPDPVLVVNANQLLTFGGHSSPIVATEALYYSYKMLKDGSDQAKAQKALQTLIDRYPDNWIYRIEFYRYFGSTGEGKEAEKRSLYQGIESSLRLNASEKEHIKAVLAAL
jgi:hypothetical protein